MLSALLRNGCLCLVTEYHGIIRIYGPMCKHRAAAAPLMDGCFNQRQLKAVSSSEASQASKVWLLFALSLDLNHSQLHIPCVAYIALSHTISASPLTLARSVTDCCVVTSLVAHPARCLSPLPSHLIRPSNPLPPIPRHR